MWVLFQDIFIKILNLDQNMLNYLASKYHLYYKENPKEIIYVMPESNEVFLKRGI